MAEFVSNESSMLLYVAKQAKGKNEGDKLIWMKMSQK